MENWNKDSLKSFIDLKSIIWEELRIEIGEIPKVIYHVWDDIRIATIELSLEKGNRNRGKYILQNRL